MVIVVLSALFVITLMAGIPIAFSTGIASLGAILVMGNVPLHVIVIRAFPPIRALMAEQTSKSRGFFTGPEAVWIGAFIMVAAVCFAAFCAMGAYAFFDPNILRILIPAIIVFSIGSGVASTLIRKKRS